jgi:outer membrane immunogenic protein
VRSFCLGLVVASVSTAPAMAEGPAVPHAYDWSGVYLGGQVGYGFGDEEWTLLDNPGDGESGSIGEVVTDHDTEGLLGGAQVGVNWQRGNFVFGVEADFSLADIDGSSARIAGGEKPGPREWATDMNWLATVGPRIGYAADRTLFYVEGGLAIADEDYYHLGAKGGDPPGEGSEREYNGSDTRGGLFFGAGIERSFTNAWSGRIEYNYVAFGGDSASLFGAPPNPAVFDIDQDVQVVKFSINYHFQR